MVNEANGLFGEDLGGKTTAISVAESEYLDQELPSRFICRNPDLSLAVVLIADVEEVVEDKMEGKPEKSLGGRRIVVGVDVPPASRGVCIMRKVLARFAIGMRSSR